MDPQVLSRGYNGSMFPKNNNNKTKKTANYSKNNKLNGSSPKGTPTKNYMQPPQNSYSQYRPSAYPSWNVFNGSRPGQSFAKFEGQHYAKSYNLNYNSDKAGRSTGASDNENGNSELISELSGFKIVQNAKTIHDETTEDTDVFSAGESDSEESQKPTKFASSMMTIGPNAKEISIPMFADEDA